jgi:cation transport ATPase
MIEDFRKRFWISVVLTIPILMLSPLIQHFLGIKEAFSFRGDIYVLFALSTLTYFYGGFPFLMGLFNEMKKLQPEMMTLIALAISIAYFYSSAVVFGVKGEVFFWELATLIDIMLLGHWIEMKSVMGASKALEELAKLMPDEAHKIDDGGNVADISVSKEAIKQLKEMGIKPMMLTGDNKQVAKWVADELGLDDYFAEVLPDKKSEKIKEVQNRGMIVAMTGDGVNDAPALAQADIGIAIGAGTSVAVETADIILVRSNPKDVVSLIKFSKATYRKMIQNLIWATGYNVIAIPLAAGVLYSQGIILNPAIGAVLMSISTIVVAINAKLLKVS